MAEKEMVNVNGDIGSHSLGFLYWNYSSNAKISICILSKPAATDSNLALNYIVVSGHSEKREQSANLDMIWSFLQSTELKKYSMIIKTQVHWNFMKNIGFEIWKFFRTNWRKSNITFKDAKNYRYCVPLTIIRQDQLLSNKNIIAFINKYGWFYISTPNL